MNKVILLAASLLIPGTLLAEINVDVHIDGYSGSKKVNNCQIQRHQPVLQYIDEGDPWFEEVSSDGLIKISFEYQWTKLGNQRVLRFRQISFNLKRDQWVFGEWQTSQGRHVRSHENSSNWHKTYQKRGSEVVCFYEYTSPHKNDQKNYRSFRYEYKPLRISHEYTPVQKTIETTVISPDGVFKSKTVVEKKEPITLNYTDNYRISKISGREQIR